MSNTVQAGVADVGSSGSKAKSITVKFPRAFTATPVVVVTPMEQDGNSPVRWVALVDSVRKDGFTATVAYRMDNSNEWGRDVKLNWMAMPAS